MSNLTIAAVCGMGAPSDGEARLHRLSLGCGVLWGLRVFLDLIGPNLGSEIVFTCN